MITSLRSLTSERIRRREGRIRQLEQERDVREMAIFRRIPRLDEIKGIQTTLGLDVARTMLKQPTAFGKSFEEMQTWSIQLNAERDKLMRKHGIDPRELEVHWDCPRCKNSGWLPPEVAGPNTVLPAQKCGCLVQEEFEDLYRASGLTGHLRQQTFEQFKLTVYPPADRPHMAKLAEHCKTYAQNIVDNVQRESLLLMGDVGRGKTFLSSCIANRAVAGKRAVVYFTFSEFLDLVRMHRFEEEDVYRQGMQRLLEADLIILDDLGAEKLTDFVGQELFNLINHRMNRQMPMVVSTNLNPREIEQFYGQRIGSRLLNAFDVMQLRGEDVRAVLKQQRL